MVFAIYVDSYAFVFATSILQHSLGVNSSFQLCESAILLCLAFYVTTKVSHPWPQTAASVLTVGQIVCDPPQAKSCKRC